MKLLVSVFIAVSILTTTSISSYAIALDDKTANSNISLYYETAQKTYSSLKISGNTANCYSYAIANTTCTITLVQTLEKKQSLVWKSVPGASWSMSCDSLKLNASNSYSQLTAGKYRLKTVFTFTLSNGESETKTKYSSVESI